MRLCLYLVETGQITSEQALHAVRHQMAMRHPIGQIAVEAGLMTTKQVFDVLARQLDLDTSKQFGQIAIEFGYLTRGQVNELILKQIDIAPKLTDILIGNGAVTVDQVIEAEIHYRRSRIGRVEV